MEIVIICSAAAFCTFVFFCAMSLGLNTAEKAGGAIALVGFLGQGIMGFYFTAHPVLQINRTERLILEIGRAGILITCIGVALFTGSAACRTWRHRRSLFPFLYGVAKPLEKKPSPKDSADVWDRDLDH